MEKKTEEFRNFSMEEAMRLANSDTARQLIALLKAQNADALQQAAAQASQGDFASAKKKLSALLKSPEAQDLLRKLGE